VDWGGGGGKLGRSFDGGRGGEEDGGRMGRGCEGRWRGMEGMGKRSSSSFVWGAGGNAEDVPLGAAKWITFPSSLNIFTSSIAWMGCTLSFLSDVCSFLSSVPDVLCTFFCFLRGVPLPLETG